MTISNQSSAKRPRLLFVVGEESEANESRALFHLICELDRRGWTVALVAPATEAIGKALAEERIRVELGDDFLVDPKRDRLRALCREFDCIVANTLACWPAVTAAHDENIPAIWYIHEGLEAARRIEKSPELRTALHFARLLAVPTKQTARLLVGATHTQIETLPYGIPDISPPIREAQGKAVVFVAPGSFGPRQGQSVLIEAIAGLDRSVREMTSFRFAGRARDRQFLTRIREGAARLGNIEVVDSSNDDETLRSIETSDVVISLSPDATLSGLIIEAANRGKALISSQASGISEWIHDELNGLLVSAEDPAELAEAISRCARDRPLLHRLAAAARRTYEHHFTLERFTERFTALLELAMQPRSDPKISRTYERWVDAFDDETASSRLAISREVRQLPRQPLISILLPVYNPDLKLLREAIDSVRNQIYPRWELCLADDASTNSEVRPFLEEVARSDTRVKVILRKRNGHISACSNSALSLATGEWCALLDQDDTLAASALAFVAKEIADHPDAGLIYSDEDKIDNRGARSEPYFKTDWNPQLFLAQNFVNHLSVYRLALIREVGGFRENFEGSQDYDLVWRCIEKLSPEKIRHIPRILYHWRKVQGSVAAAPEAKPYAKEAARRAIAEHLERTGIKAQVMACPENPEAHRVKYEIAAPEPLVSIVIPTRDRVEFLRKCIQGLREKTNYPRIEIVVVDNDSVEIATREYLHELAANKIARVVADPGVFNFSRLINRGCEAAAGEILALLNNDIEIDEADWLREMVSHAARSEVGAVGARLWYPNGLLQHGGVIVGLGGVARHVNDLIPRGHPGYFGRALLQQNYSCVTGACMVLRKKVFADLGGFNARDLAVNFNDVDFCLRLLEQGLQVVWTPYANLTHHESASRGHQRSPEEQSQFFREANYMQEKWGAYLLSDPFYNPNLSLHAPGFELSFPPRISRTETAARDQPWNRAGWAGRAA